MNSVFVGREAELKKAGELLDTARSGSESVLCLEGGPGIGKTALTRAIVEKGRADGLPVLASSFVDGQDLPPLWPWRHILSKAARLVELGTLPSSSSDQAPYLASSLSQIYSLHAHLLGHLNSDWEQVPGLSELPANQRKYRFFEWISAFLHDLARSTPILMVLEDLHNGDDASLHLIQYLVDVLEFSGVFMVLTWRPAELRGSSRITELKEQLGLLQTAALVTLDRFGTRELGQYLSRVAGSIGKDDLEHVLAWTQGVPLRAYLYAERLGPELTRSPDPTLTMSQLFCMSVSRELSEAARKIVKQLALLGNAFSPDEIDALAPKRTTETTVKEELLASGLIRADDDGAFHRFIHDELRVAVLELVTASERERLVEETASRIEAMAGAKNERRTRLLKELFLSARSGRFAEQAVRYTVAAVELAEGQNAWPEVIADLERLVAQHQALIGPEATRGLKLRLCRAYHHSFNEPAGVPLALELFEQFKSEGDTERLIDLVLSFGFGWALDMHNVFPDILALIESLPPDHPKRAAVLSAAGTSLAAGLDPAKAVALSREAVDLARANGDLQVEISASVCLAMSLKRLRRFEEVVSIVDALLRDHAAKVGAAELTYALFAKGLALLNMERLPEFGQVLQNMTELSRLYDNPVMRVYLRMAADRKALKTGAWPRLKLEDPKGTENDFHIHLPAVTAAYLTGNVEAADRFVVQFMQSTGTWSDGARGLDQMYTDWFVALRTYILSDDRLLEQCARSLPKLYRSLGKLPGFLTDFPICAARISRIAPCTVAEAHDYYNSLLEADAYSYEEEEYTIAAAKALLALRWDDRDLAARHFEEAVAFCDKQMERPWRAHYLFELALLLPPAERGRARQLVGEASAEAQQLGLTPLLTRIEREWTVGGVHPLRPAGPSDTLLDPIRTAGITRREREVLECLVEGLTDKEIAATLNISPYTVGNHLRNIYAKTKCANRGEAAHWAITRHFVRLTTDEDPGG